MVRNFRQMRGTQLLSQTELNVLRPKFNCSIVGMFITAIVIFLSACNKEIPEITKYELTADERTWIPYATPGFQSQFFRDETGRIHNLNLYWEANVFDRYGDKKSERHVDFFNPGGSECYTEMIKYSTGLQLSFVMGNYDVRFNESELNNPVASQTIHGNTFTDVVVGVLDSTIYQNAQYNKVYICKGYGIVGIELRNGRYFVME